jgi:hypothetical protein
MARRRTGPAAFRRRGGPLHRRPTPRNRRRGAGRRRCSRARNRHRLLRRAASARGLVSDDSHGRRLLDHARPPGIDRRRDGNGDRRGRGRRHDRPERRRRVGGALRPSRHSPDRRAARVSGSALAAPRAHARSASASASASVGGAAAGDCARGPAASRGSPCRSAMANHDSRPEPVARSRASATRRRRLALRSAGAWNAPGRCCSARANCTTRDATRAADLRALGNRRSRDTGASARRLYASRPSRAAAARDSDRRRWARTGPAARPWPEPGPARPDGSRRPPDPGSRVRRLQTRRGPDPPAVEPVVPP